MPVTPPGVQVIRDESGSLRQVVSPGCVADIVVSNAYKYGIHYYRLDDVTWSSGQGLYLINEDESPFASYVVWNPDGASASNRLCVQGAKDSRVVNSEYVYTETAGVGKWTLSEAEGMRFLSVEQQTNGALRAETRTTRDASSNIEAKTQTTYETFGWGVGIAQQVSYSSSDEAKTNLTYYYSNSSQTATYGRVSMTLGANGSWRKYEYDAKGRESVVISSWRDMGTNASASDARSTEYAYVPVDPNEIAWGSTIEEFKPRTVTEKIQGEVVARSWYSFYENDGNGRVEITARASDLTDSYTNDSVQKTIYIYNPEDEDDPGSLCIKSITYPDGRKDSYSYEFGSCLTNAAPPNTFTNNGGEGFVRITITHGTTDSASGIANKTTQERRVVDSFGRRVLDEILVHSGSGYEVVQWTSTATNSLGEAVAQYRSDGTRTDTEWGCCGKERETGADGSVFENDYDDLIRLNRVSKVGTNGTDNLTTQYTLDAAGRRLAEIRTGTGVAGQLVTTNSYDWAGRLLWTRDPAGLVSSNVYAGSGLTVTTYMPGGTTRVTERYKDGRTKSVSGTGVTAQYYDYGANADGTQWTKVWTGAEGTNSAVWSKTTTDMLGRTVKEERPGYGGATLATTYTYDDGRLVKTQVTGVSPQPFATLYAYDELGNRTLSAVDVNGNDTIDLGGPDRVSGSDSFFAQEAEEWWRISASSVYPADGSAVPLTNSLQKQQLTGLSASMTSKTVSEDLLGNETVSTTAVDRDNKTVTRTVVYADSTNDAVSITVNGLLVSSKSKTGVDRLFSYDGLERRTGATDPRTGTSTTWYNDKGQVAAVTNAAGQGTQYAYDAETGRRTSVTDPLGKRTYYAYDVKGALVQTWGDSAYPVSYGYWHKTLDADNTSQAAYELLSIVGVLKNGGTNGTDIVTVETGRVFVAETPEAFAYDDDGNLLSDERFAYSWNGENRLIGVETLDAVTNAGVPKVKAAYAYDYMGRRVSKTVSHWDTDHWSPITDHLFTYDGWNLVQELTHSQTHTLTNSYVWGLDLSGSLQGAGGIGGLLMRVADGAGVLYAYDANGNVGQLVDAEDGTNMVARYEYDPYGNVLVAQGDAAEGNPFRFSTKYTDDETKLVYYGLRFYSPGMGRWVNRDPVAERGGANLYAFARNSPTVLVDYMGLTFRADFRYPEKPETEGYLGESDITTMDYKMVVGVNLACAQEGEGCWHTKLDGDILVIVTGWVLRGREDVDRHEREHARDAEIIAHNQFLEYLNGFEKGCRGFSEAQCVAKALNRYAGYMYYWLAKFVSCDLRDLERDPNSKTYRAQYEEWKGNFEEQKRALGQELTHCATLTDD